MNTEMTTAQANAIGDLGNLRNSVARARANVPTAAGLPYLRFLKDGTWVFGQDNTETQEGSLWAINPLTIEHGWVCWTRYPEHEKRKNEKLGEVMVPISQDRPSVATLENHAPWKWSEQYSMQLRCLNGEDKDTEVMFSTSSVGGCQAVAALLDALLAQIDTGSKDVVPVVTLDADHYSHKTYGKTYTPVMSIDRWVPLTSTPPAVEKAPAKVEKPKAAGPVEQFAEEAEAQAQAEAPPPAVGRRRRRPAA